MSKREGREKEKKAEEPKRFSDADFTWMKDLDRKGAEKKKRR